MYFEKPEPERVPPEVADAERRLAERAEKRAKAAPQPEAAPDPAPEFDPALLAQGVVNRHGAEYARTLARHILNLTKKRKRL